MNDNSSGLLKFGNCNDSHLATLCHDCRIQTVNTGLGFMKFGNCNDSRLATLCHDCRIQTANTGLGFTNLF